MKSAGINANKFDNPPKYPPSSLIKKIAQHMLKRVAIVGITHHPKVKVNVISS